MKELKTTDFATIYEEFGGYSPGGSSALGFAFIEKRDVPLWYDGQAIVDRINMRGLPSGDILYLVDDFPWSSRKAHYDFLNSLHEGALIRHAMKAWFCEIKIFT